MSAKKRFKILQSNTNQAERFGVRYGGGGSWMLGGNVGFNIKQCLHLCWYLGPDRCCQCIDRTSIQCIICNPHQGGWL